MSAEPLSATPDGGEESALRTLPYAFAKRHGVLVVDEEDGKVTVAYRPGISAQSLTELRRFLNIPLRPVMVAADHFERMLQDSYEGDSDGAARMMEDLGEEIDLDQISLNLPEPEDLLESADDAPIIRLINALLTGAIKENASDIHIESFENRLMIRFRVDGVLREALQPPRALGPLLVSRVKVMAHLDIAEKRLPQDGRISLRVAGRPVDVRVSTLPTGHGERVVMRLLDKREGRLDLRHLGMEPNSEARLSRLIQRPHGILLVTGPTGSGKTTTLYAGLTRLNDRKRNIMTVEDPIEYYLDGISQTQVNTKVEMTFARGLRAILRQDPDVVMVGEIRDLETAEIAVQASLTGHLVLSTLHTNSAVGAIARLRDMGVEPFLLSSSLVGVISQRLVRRLCPSCKHPHHASAGDCEVLGVNPTVPPTIYTPVGCDQCNQSGYRGRSGIFELVLVDEAMQTMIHEGRGELDLERHARKFSPSIRDDGRRRVLAGDTALAELVRVTQEA
ncbi:MAG TPA: type II secretion system ATPase GspE [Candidatus Competibacter sp.]|nr:type II secretion system ATPase GspE [Candidatus Competibacteraceae bacterium]HAO34080.1 type II secretion system protein GspE [Candidatus Competibacteraceae bacterium]HRE55344.1 type II secretion system ATPase GspE [Candidatus Competibacter sp.]HUM94797.1 type II secretion system ATPase GspE [Candidatus Competibacter sp.]